MSVRQIMNNNPLLTTLVVVGVLAVVLIVIVVSQFRTPPAARIGDAWFLELETGELFAASGTRLPPIDGPSGHEAVRAYLFSCGECTAEQWFGYLETYTDEARGLMAEYEGDDMMPPVVEEQVFAGHLVRLLEGGQWVPQAAPEGERVLEAVFGRCEGQRATRCNP